MKTVITKSVLIIVLIFIQGCTHTLYQGDLVSVNNRDEQQSFRLWWIKTSLFSSAKGDGNVRLDTGCGRYGLTESEQGVTLELPADQFQSTHAGTGDSVNCGKITNLDRIRDFNEGELALEIYCAPLNDGFSVVNKTLPRIGMVHRFSIQDQEIDNVEFSPEPLPCN